MNTKLKDVLSFILAFVIFFILLGVFTRGGNLAFDKFFAPKEEQVRRETFEQSKAYNDGMFQELRAMQFEYLKAPTNSQDALASVILHRVAAFPTSKLPADLSSFITGLELKQTAAPAFQAR